MKAKLSPLSASCTPKAVNVNDTVTISVTIQNTGTAIMPAGAIISMCILDGASTYGCYDYTTSEPIQPSQNYVAQFGSIIINSSVSGKNLDVRAWLYENALKKVAGIALSDQACGSIITVTPTVTAEITAIVVS